MVDRRLPAPATGLPALMNSENKILQIDTKWSEMRKKHNRRRRIFTGRLW